MIQKHPTEGEPPQDVLQIFETNQEAIIITLNPDHTSEGEFNIECFMKLEDDNGKLSQYLASILENLLAKDGKPSSNIETEATTSP